MANEFVTIGWYRDGELIDTHTLRRGAAEAAIRGKQEEELQWDAYAAGNGPLPIISYAMAAE